MYVLEQSVSGHTNSFPISSVINVPDKQADVNAYPRALLRDCKVRKVTENLKLGVILGYTLFQEAIMLKYVLQHRQVHN